MATSNVIAGTTSADTSYTLSLAAGEAAHFRAFGLGTGEEIQVESQDAAGNYEQITGWTPEGKPRRYVMSREANSVRVNGPLELRLRKRETQAAVSVVRYT